MSPPRGKRGTCLMRAGFLSTHPTCCSKRERLVRLYLKKVGKRKTKSFHLNVSHFKTKSLFTTPVSHRPLDKTMAKVRSPKWKFTNLLWLILMQPSLDRKEIKPVNPKGNHTWIFIHWKDWGWSCSDSATWYEQPTHWCWERLRAKEEGSGRGWNS